MFFQLLATIVGLSGVGGLLYLNFVVADLFEPSKNNCALGNGATREQHLVLTQENMRDMRRPIAATVIQLPDNLARYSDEETTCRLLALTQHGMGTAVYKDSVGSIEVIVGPRQALRVVYITNKGVVTRATAPAH